MGVAPSTEEMLSTIPPRANGGNMDPGIVEEQRFAFSCICKGALFSIGDGHTVRGYGEVCGSAIEAPMTFTYRLRVLKNKPSVKNTV